MYFSLIKSFLGRKNCHVRQLSYYPVSYYPPIFTVIQSESNLLLFWWRSCSFLQLLSGPVVRLFRCSLVDGVGPKFRLRRRLYRPPNREWRRGAPLGITAVASPAAPLSLWQILSRTWRVSQRCAAMLQPCGGKQNCESKVE